MIMDPITIQAGLQVIAQLIAAVQAAHAKGDTVISPEVWAEATDTRRAAQKKLDENIASHKVQP